MADLQLIETTHPNPSARAEFDHLVGINANKEALVEQLALVLAPGRAEAWRKKHHPQGLPLLDRLGRTAPLVLLSGEVGCGKTALARSVGTPLSELLDQKVTLYETPSDVRGSGMVGDLSRRITASFEQARRRTQRGVGLLLIDEADDLATERAQEQAHHEDRAGVNALIKEIDGLARGQGARLAVILITNRAEVIDPAVHRRASLHLTFGRPEAAARRAVFAALLGSAVSPSDLARLVQASEQPVPYSFSDLVERLGRRVLMAGLRRDVPAGVELVLEMLGEVEPTPLLKGAHDGA